MLLARFMVEDNSDEFVDFLVDREGSFIQAKSIFQKVVGEYRIFSVEEEMKRF